MADLALPPAFGDLAVFAEWSLPTETLRAQKRRASTYEGLCAFYAGLGPRLLDALNHLDAHDVDQLGPEDQNLFNICLSYAEIAPFVEQYHRTAIPESFDEARFIAAHDLPAGGR